MYNLNKLYKFINLMSQSTANTINQAVLRMDKVFNDIDANKFLECLINKIDYDAK